LALTARQHTEEQLRSAIASPDVRGMLTERFDTDAIRAFEIAQQTLPGNQHPRLSVIALRIIERR
jgi:hypothetical protein